MPQMPKLPGDEPNDEFWVQWDKHLDDEREAEAELGLGLRTFVFLAFFVFVLLSFL